MHQSIPATTISPLLPPGNCGELFAHIVSARGRVLAYPGATPGLLKHTWFLFSGKDQSFVTNWLVSQ